MSNRSPRRGPALALRRRVRPLLEVLESRVTPSTFDSLITPVVVAGDDAGSPTDSPTARVDANTTTSNFTGVGSVQVSSRRGTYIGTGTVLTDSVASATYVLTAGHVVDVNGDGKFNNKDGVTALTFWFNVDGNQKASLSVSGSALSSSVFVNPSYTGFNRPSVNDDLAVIKFAGSPPAGVQSYSIYAGDVYHHVFTMVGYGRSGYGDVGYTTNASWSVKRVGQNVVDAFSGQDDSGQGAANEVFRFDFDGPTAATNYFGDNGSINGGLTLGNDVETTLGGGDSGGPSFVWVGGTPTLAGVNTFTQGSTAPRFGSLGGGIVVGAYVAWLQSVVPGLGVITGALSRAAAGVPGTGDKASLAVPVDISPALLAALAPNVAGAPAAQVVPPIFFAPQFATTAQGVQAAQAPTASLAPLGRIMVAPAQAPQQGVGRVTVPLSVEAAPDEPADSDGADEGPGDRSPSDAEPPAARFEALLDWAPEAIIQAELATQMATTEPSGWIAASDAPLALATLTALAYFANGGWSAEARRLRQSTEYPRPSRHRAR